MIECRSLPSIPHESTLPAPSGWQSRISARVSLTPTPTAWARKVYVVNTALHPGFLFILILTLTLLFLAMGSQAALADPNQRLREFARQTQTLSGQFSQVVIDRNGRRTQESSGEFQLSRPGKFRWLYNRPYEQLIVGDGQRVWIYDRDLEQVSVRRVDRAIGESPAALLAGSNEIERHFNVREAGSRDGLDWLEATPKSREGGFERVRLGFRNQSLQAMELLDSFGQTTVVRFTNLRANLRLGAELFRFQPPPGVDVIGDDGS